MDIQKGGYVLKDHIAPLQLVIIATGSEVQMAIQAQTELESEQIGVRVISMPCVERFKMQPIAYQNAVLPPDIKRVAVEAGVKETWLRFTPYDAILGLETFGYSAPGADVYQAMGLTQANLLKMCHQILQH